MARETESTREHFVFCPAGSGDVFEYRYYKTRADGKRVQANFVVGTVDELRTGSRSMGENPQHWI